MNILVKAISSLHFSMSFSRRHLRWIFSMSLLRQQLRCNFFRIYTSCSLLFLLLLLLLLLRSGIKGDFCLGLIVNADYFKKFGFPESLYLLRYWRWPYIVLLVLFLSWFSVLRCMWGKWTIFAVGIKVSLWLGKAFEILPFLSATIFKNEGFSLLFV